jgi:hypothetical protein
MVLIAYQEENKKVSDNYPSSSTFSCLRNLAKNYNNWCIDSFEKHYSGLGPRESIRKESLDPYLS